MLQITSEQVAAMTAAQDSAAQEFWAYPSAEWQFGFQEQWLLEAFGEPRAQGPDGLVWGADVIVDVPTDAA